MSAKTTLETANELSENHEPAPPAAKRGTPVVESVQPVETDDEFSVENLRRSQDFAERVGAKKIVTTVPCRKPNRHEWVRVRPGEEWRLETSIFESKVHRETYLIAPRLWSECLGDVIPVCLYLAVTRQNDVFLWPCRKPSDDGRGNLWHESAIEAAERAQHGWVRVAANMKAGLYDLFEARAELPDPDWPEMTLQEIIDRAFRKRKLSDPDHEVLRELREGK